MCALLDNGLLAMTMCVLIFKRTTVFVKIQTLEKMHAGGSGVRLDDNHDIKLFILVGWGRSVLIVAWPTGVQLVVFFCSGVSKLFGAQGSLLSGSLLNL